MEDLIKHPIVVLIALAAVGLSSLVNIKLSTDPHARPDPYTGTQADARKVEVDRRLLENEVADAAFKKEMRLWIRNHVEWGNKRVETESLREGKQNQQIEELYRRLP